MQASVWRCPMGTPVPHVCAHGAYWGRFTHPTPPPPLPCQLVPLRRERASLEFWSMLGSPFTCSCGAFDSLYLTHSTTLVSPLPFVPVCAANGVCLVMVCLVRRLDRRPRRSGARPSCPRRRHIHTCVHVRCKALLGSVGPKSGGVSRRGAKRNNIWVHRFREAGCRRSAASPLGARAPPPHTQSTTQPRQSKRSIRTSTSQ